jgi:alpha-N-arabinofuranosidase
VAVVDASATFDEVNGKGAIFLVHRGVDQLLPVEVRVEGGAVSVVDVQQMSGMDPKAANSFERPDVVVPRRLASPVVADGVVRMKLPPLSFTMLRVKVAAK